MESSPIYDTSSVQVKWNRLVCVWVYMSKNQSKPPRGLQPGEGNVPDCTFQTMWTKDTHFEDKVGHCTALLRSVVQQPSRGKTPKTIPGTSALSHRDWSWWKVQSCYFQTSTPDDVRTHDLWSRSLIHVLLNHCHPRNHVKFMWPSLLTHISLT